MTGHSCGSNVALKLGSTVRYTIKLKRYKKKVILIMKLLSWTFLRLQIDISKINRTILINICICTMIQEYFFCKIYLFTKPQLLYPNHSLQFLTLFRTVLLLLELHNPYINVYSLASVKIMKLIYVNVDM